MEPVPIVMYVSSDEEEEEVACLEEKGRRAIDLDWIKEFLDMSDEETNEVVVLDEVKKPELKSKSLDVKKVDDDDEEEEEDDCVVLDGDPENRVTSVEGLSTGSDELVVVGEKGQIACRDYPHPRHLCVKFPYSSAPHEKHCDQCHCYVCDSVAPCLKWGTGHLGTDHCHATDKSETWRTLRKNFMLGKTAPLLASSTHGTLSDVRTVQHNHTLPLDIMLLSPNSMLLNHTSLSTATHPCSPVNVIPQNQASRTITMHERSSLYSSLRNHVSSPNAIPECSTATNFTIPSGTNNGRCRVSGSTLVRNRYQSHSVPQHGLGVRNHAIQRVRGHGVSSLGHQFLHSHMMLNRLGSVGVGSTLPMNHSAHGASGFDNHINPAQQYGRYHAATGFLNNRTCYGQNDVCVPQNLLYPDPCSQPNNLRSVSNYSTAYETQLCYLSNGSQNFYANCVQGNNVPSSNVASLSINRVLNEHQVGSQNENACGNVIHCGTTRQYSCQQKHYDTSQIESALKADFSAFDSSRMEDTSQSISHLQGSGSMNIYSAKESGAQFTGSTCLGSVDDIKQWLFDEENSVPVGADVALAFDSELNIPSPDLSTFDASTFLYDFENSWDCPAQSLV
ncbi:uncharacterized protein LOC109803984 [Cajanus cajan]|uniref:uncharacterized protein LOC109803984 n=1 Tax=Cajanus cajan TaxID=3821 RepID=UPI00098D85F1|nr:uncharacterized protein LOC109803984 [Cajanus cajan]